MIQKQKHTLTWTWHSRHDAPAPTPKLALWDFSSWYSMYTSSMSFSQRAATGSKAEGDVFLTFIAFFAGFFITFIAFMAVEHFNSIAVLFPIPGHASRDKALHVFVHVFIASVL